MTSPAYPRKHVAILGTQAHALVNLRGPLLRALVEAGHRVTAIAEPAPDDLMAPLRDMGINYIPLQLERAGLNPMADITAMLRIRRLLREIRPDVFFGYSIKPVIYGTLAAKAAGIRRRAAMMTGLGYAFTDGDGRQAVQAVARLLLRLGVSQSDLLILHNGDDLQTLRDAGVVRHATRTAVVNGSGVDLAHFAPAPLPSGPLTFLMIARLLKDKGLLEYVEAARRIKATYPDVRFMLVGGLDPNPAGIGQDQLDAWRREGIIAYQGELRDVRPALAQSHVYVLPSYREGTPRTVLEAMAMRRAVITTTAPGCRETIVDGVSGYLVPPRSAEALADRMMEFIRSPQLVSQMADASLARVKEKFEAGAVARDTAGLVLGEITR